VASFTIPSQRLDPGTAVVPLTTVQQALWRLGMPILDAGAVTKYKKGAKRGMLWQAIRWQILATAALVALISLGRQPGRVAAVGAAAVLLTTLFGWLLTCDLKWRSIDYSTYQSLHPVPQHVSVAANALLSHGVAAEQICVEYLKADPVLFVQECTGALAGDCETIPVNRYDLIVW
jgi:hypothetical protein